MTRPWLVTGAAGFIGAAVCERLLARDQPVLGVDNLNDYYDPALKQARLARLCERAGFRFAQVDIANSAALDGATRSEGGFERVIHLAAQAGVRYSLTHPEAYVQSNLVGQANVLELCLQRGCGHLVFASSSSVYGLNRSLPFRETDPTDQPASFYGATKKAGEALAHAYAHLYRIPTTGLRFFTVYGPWGRPDMSPMLFASAILEGREIPVFNHGQMSRDFTFVGDIVEGLLRVAEHPPAGESPPYRLFNIGNHQPVALMRFIEVLEAALGGKAILNLQPMQPGDVVDTYADVEALAALTGFRPQTPIEAGVGEFARWYRSWRGR